VGTAVKVNPSLNPRDATNSQRSDATWIMQIPSNITVNTSHYLNMAGVVYKITEVENIAPNGTDSIVVKISGAV
jgi:hypothetical protein